jgi:hypothetical protein
MASPFVLKRFADRDPIQRLAAEAAGDGYLSYSLTDSDGVAAKKQDNRTCH